jgi:hypothetical protein
MLQCSLEQAAPKKTRRDSAEIARENVEQIIGEKLTGEPLDLERKDEQPDTRDQVAAALSTIGASKGGNARGQSLSATKRKQIARKAARARWLKRSD